MKKILFLTIFFLTSHLFAAGDDPMVLVYDLDITRTVNIQIGAIIPGDSVTIDWGDGSDTTVMDSCIITHEFESKDIDTVKITGGLTWLGSDSLPSKWYQKALIEVPTWGNLPLRRLKNCFYASHNLISIPKSLPDSVWDISFMLYNADAFNEDLSSWDVSNVTDMSGVFGVMKTFNGDISNWDVSNVTNMSRMFVGTDAFNGDISKWNVSSVTEMISMFSYAEAFNGDISNWDVSNVTDMRWMFAGPTPFNQNLTKWDVSKVTSMQKMFAFSHDFTGDLSSWDVSNVTDMSEMFFCAYSFNGDIRNWDVSSVTDMSGMFSETKTFNGDISNWDVSSVTNMSRMFSQADAFNGDISDWDVSNVTDMHQMFHYVDIFNGDISNWDVSNVTDMHAMFKGSIFFNCDLSSWDVSNVTDMNGMFAWARAFNGNLSSWDVSSVTNMSDMFEFATSFNCNLSSWDVSNVTNMNEMFYRAYSFNGDLSNWNLPLVTETKGMLDTTAMSVTNYDKILKGWGVQALNSNNTLGVANLFYSSTGESARSGIIENYQWKFYGDSLVDELFTITYDENYSDGSATVIEEFSPAAKYVSPSYFPKREGYKLTGWNSQPDGSGFAFNNTINITEDITFYAQWEKGTAIIQTDTTTLTGVKGLLVSPNPVPQSEEKVTLVIPSDLSGFWEISICDVLGNELDGGAFEAQGGTAYEWDLCNKAGAKVAGGSYVIRAIHTDKKGREKSFKRKIGVAQ